MATVISDTFTDVSDTVLSSHTPEVGGAWTRHGSYTSATLRVSNANRCRKSGDAAAACYYNNADPGADNYSVEVSTRLIDATGAAFGPAARIASGANTMYMCRYSTSAGAWQLYKLVAGAATLLGSWSETLGAGDERLVKLTVGTTAQEVVIAGVSRITATDGDITARGYAGLREGTAAGHSDAAGCHADGFVVTNSLTDGTYPAWARRASGIWTPGRR